MSATCSISLIFCGNSGFSHQYNWPGQYRRNIVDVALNTNKCNLQYSKCYVRNIRTDQKSKATNIRRDKKCPIEKQQGRHIPCAPSPWWSTRAFRKCRQSSSTSGTIHRTTHALSAVLESIFKYRSEEKIWYKIISKSYLIQCTRDIWITFTRFTQNPK